MTPHEYLNDCAETYHEKHKVYGPNYLQIGKAMEAIFPNGLTVKTADEWNKLHCFLLSMVKITRYANNYQDSHEDSLRDLIVYTAMLQYVDEMIQEEKRKKIEKENNDQAALF